MTRYRVLPYRAGSRGATALSRALGGMCLRLEGSRFRGRQNDVIINWGNTDPWRAHVYPARFVNLPNQVRNASNKLMFFQLMRDTGNEEIIPRFWTENEKDAIPDDAFPVVCRTILAGHSGAGIVIADTRDELVDARLYVEYVKKQEEYRVHVGKRRDESIITIAVQQKRRRHDHDNPNWQVRNHANGFIYARSEVNPPDCVLDAAKKALEATSLDFGAVDVIYNARRERAYVLEINTAPGLEGSTVDDYVRFFTNV